MLENNLIVIIPGEVELRQANRITGSVTDNQGVPLPGVTIQVKGTMTGGISGADGTYAVNIPQGSTALIFSFVGYTTQEIPISNRLVIDVVMEEEITALDEVVVVGYGVQEKVM
jgi:hypothetical protein